jgi:hypothetical protein
VEKEGGDVLNADQLLFWGSVALAVLMGVSMAFGWVLCYWQCKRSRDPVQIVILKG